MIPLIKIEFEVDDSKKVVQHLKNIAIIKPKSTVQWYWSTNSKPGIVGWFKDQKFLLCPILEYWIQNRISTVLVNGTAKNEKEIHIDLSLSLHGIFSLLTLLLFSLIFFFSVPHEEIPLQAVIFILLIFSKILFDKYRDLKKTEKLITHLIEIGDK